MMTTLDCWPVGYSHYLREVEGHPLDQQRSGHTISWQCDSSVSLCRASKASHYTVTLTQVWQLYVLVQSQTSLGYSLIIWRQNKPPDTTSVSAASLPLKDTLPYLSLYVCLSLSLPPSLSPSISLLPPPPPPRPSSLQKIERILFFFFL